MEVLSRSTDNLKTCPLNSKGPFNHIKSTRQSEQRLTEQQRLVGEDGDASSEKLLEKSKFLTFEKKEGESTDCCAIRVLQTASQDKVSEDLWDGLLTQADELQFNFQAAPPLRETIKLLKEQLSEANLVREREEEELRQLVRRIQENLNTELQMEREMKHLLQDQLKKAKVCHQQECRVHRRKVKNFQQQVESLQEKLKQEVKQKEDCQREVEELKHSLKYRQESLTAVLQVETKVKHLLQEQMQEARLSYQQDCTRYKTELINIQQQAEEFTNWLQKELGLKTICEGHERLMEPSRNIQENLEAELQAEKKISEDLREQLQEAKQLHEKNSAMFKAELEKFHQLAVQDLRVEIQQEFQPEILQTEQVEKLHPQRNSTEIKKIKKFYEEQLEEAEHFHQKQCLQYHAEIESVQKVADKLKSQLQEEFQKRTLLQEERQMLKENLMSLGEASKAELQAETLKVHLLQEQLEEARLSGQQERSEHEAKLSIVQQQVEELTDELQRADRERQPYEEFIKAEKQLLLQQLEEARLSHHQQVQEAKLELDQQLRQTEIHYKQQLEELQETLRQHEEHLRSMQQEKIEMRQMLEEQVMDAETSCHWDSGSQNTNGLDEVLHKLQGELQQETKQKELLQQERDHLQRSLESSQGALTSMLDSERNLKQLHLEQLKEARLSHEEHCAKCRTEIKNLLQQTESLKLQLHREVQQRAVFQEVQEDMKESLKYSQESLLFLLNTERERNQLLQDELNGVRRSFQQRCFKHRFDQEDARTPTSPLRGINGPEAKKNEVIEMSTQKFLTRQSLLQKLFRILSPRFKQKASRQTLSQKDQRDTSTVESQEDSENFSLSRLGASPTRALQPDLQQGILQGRVVQKSQTVTQTWSKEEFLPFHLWWNMEKAMQSSSFESLLTLQPCYHETVVEDQGQKTSAGEPTQDSGEEELDEFFTPPDVLVPGLDGEFLRNFEGQEN